MNGNVLSANMRMTSTGTPSVLVKLNMKDSDSPEGDLVNAFLALLTREEKDFDVAVNTYSQYEVIEREKKFVLTPEKFEEYKKEHGPDTYTAKEFYCLHFFVYKSDEAEQQNTIAGHNETQPIYNEDNDEADSSGFVYRKKK